MSEKNNNIDVPTWNVTSICPMDIQFGFPLGTTQNNPESISTLVKMHALVPEIHIDVNESLRVSDVFKGAEYVSIKDDVSTIRIFSWHTKIDNLHGQAIDVIFHVFPNHIAVAEIELVNIPANNEQELESAALKEAEVLLKKAQLAFKEVIALLSARLKDTNAIFESAESSDKVYWPTRTLRLTPSNLSHRACPDMLSEWLKDTHRPMDAAKIASGALSESITWLKYVVVEKPDEDSNKSDYRIDALILAQYCYCAQEKCNRKLRQAIEWAFKGETKKLESQIQRAKRALETSRVLVKLHQVSVNECLRHITRRKSQLVKDIFDCWEYDRLVENGNAMLDLCEDKINESNSRQAKISASKTEYILIGISLFTVLDFFFFITQFSREAMANPTLDHNDGGPSSLLTIVADIPADIMFFLAVMFAGLIFVAYKKVKG